MEDWLAAGASTVWVVLPATRSVVVHRPGGHSERLSSGQMLRSPDLLPGFSVQVGSFFPPREAPPAGGGSTGG